MAYAGDLNSHHPMLQTHAALFELRQWAKVLAVMSMTRAILRQAAVVLVIKHCSCCGFRAMSVCQARQFACCTKLANAAYYQMLSYILANLVCNRFSAQHCQLNNTNQ